MKSGYTEVRRLLTSYFSTLSSFALEKGNLKMILMILKKGWLGSLLGLASSDKNYFHYLFFQIRKLLAG